ncbi:MAG TPA: hypothetical protein DDZ68_06465 [Parvularcula sp.]|nr:hypothetical protein [Parvularcula sp.]
MLQCIVCVDDWRAALLFARGWRTYISPDATPGKGAPLLGGRHAVIIEDAVRHRHSRRRGRFALRLKTQIRNDTKRRSEGWRSLTCQGS